ncbi:ABC transporter permease [Patescibacteria group bacterium]|nr:ABC transporter permease [Patescibacteria group bacterium]MBU2219882.1 ABC transporter permease [Patescibacteria group bacterium]
MKFLTVAKQSVIALKANKLRAFFSILGIVIGVAAVVIILSMGQGLKGLVTNEMNAFGPNLLDIAVKIPGVNQTESIASMVQGIKITTLKSKDVKDLKNQQIFPYITAVNGQAIGQEWVVYGNKERRVLVYGCSPDYPLIMKTAKMAVGRFFSDAENDSLAKVSVLGSTLAEKLFGQESPLGKNVRMKGMNFKVVGVFEPQGGMMSSSAMDMNDFIYVPLEVTLKEILGIDYLTEMHIDVSDQQYVDRAIADISRLLRRNHNITDPDKDDFEIFTMAEILKRVEEVSVILNLLLGFLAAISLLVGGIGIMNIMLVSVSERTREIGLRKSLGATAKNILWQFLIESLMITGLGGVIGIIFGIIVSTLIGLIVRTQGLPDWPLTISWLAVFGAFFLAALIGLIFGVYPARQAAKKSPMEALRYE